MLGTPRDHISSDGSSGCKASYEDKFMGNQVDTTPTKWMAEEDRIIRKMNKRGYVWNEINKARFRCEYFTKVKD